MMPVHSFIHALGSVGVFPSRAFLPAFVAALTLRFGDALPWAAQADLAGNVDTPAWFVCNTSLIILGLLSCIEWWATKDTDVRQLLHEFEAPVKTVMTLLTSMGVASAQDVELVRAIQQAGISDGLFGLMAAGTVFFLTSARRSLYDLLTEIDADDSLGLQKIFSWAEDGWVIFGTMMLIVFPLLMILLTAVVFGLLYAWQKAAERWEESQRVACQWCGNAIYPCAVNCAACGGANRDACSVNWLGLPKLDRAAHQTDHGLHLIAVGRCCDCATRFKQRQPRQTCECCHRELFDDDAEIDAYLRLVEARRLRTLLICFILGLVPVVGVVPAIIFYRFQLINPLRRYVPFGSALWAKWLARIAGFALVAVQWVPLVGGVSLPIMVAINHAIYRRAFRSAWQGAQSHAHGRRELLCSRKTVVR